MTPVSSFGPYPIREKISQGEFSQIFAVEKDGQIVALKKLKPYLKYDYEFTTLIDNEAALLSKVQDPEHFPKFVEHGEIDSEHYILLELIDGIDLGKVNRRDERGEVLLPLSLACRIIQEMGRGLKSLHGTAGQSGQPCVHADLRPSNVMVTAQGEVKLIDLGLKGGTFIYMPLSRMHSRQIDPYTDIYALGHIFYEITHGEQFFKAGDKLETYFEMRDKKIAPEIFSAKLPSSIRYFLTELLQQENEPRYSSLPPLLENFEAILREENLLSSQQELAIWIRDFQTRNSS